MRRPSFTTDRRSDIDLLMTPMIDVVFQLIIFFVWTSSMAAVEHLLPSNLAAMPGSGTVSAEPTPPPDFDPVIVKVVWLADRPGWIVSGNAIPDFAAVRRTLADVAQIKNDVPIVIDPAPEVPLGFVIDLYDSARLAGFQEIQFAASEGI